MKPAFTLRSPETGTDYVIYLEVPAAAEPGPYPAILFMDGDDQFKFAVEAYRALRAKEEVPPLVLAGVGYGASYMKPANKRLRDYTATPWGTEAESGGADTFLKFLTTPFWRELTRWAPVRDDVRGIGGHSLGSLLAVHALFQPKPFFNRVLASAPSLWWDERAPITAAEKLQRTGVALPAKLFLSVGEKDSPSMNSDLTLFEGQLAARPFPKLEIISRRFAHRDHFNVMPDAFSAGLVALFGAERAGGRA